MRSAAGRLAAVDEANIVLDHVGQVNVFLVACLLAQGGFVGGDGSPDLAALRDVLRARIASIPALRRVPIASGRGHRWVEAAPDLERHVRLIDPVDGLAGLQRRCGELMDVPLSLDSPPWELLVVPGARADGIGIVLRIHHAIADGMTAVAIVRHLFDQVEPDAAPTAAPSASPATGSGSGSAAPWHPFSGSAHFFRRIAYGLRRIVIILFGRGIGPTVLLGERGPQRGVAFVDADLAALEARAHPLGATVNDALLSAVAAGYIAALRAAGAELLTDVPVSVPVALRRRGTSGNQVGVMLVRLPLGEGDSVARLRLIAERTVKEKARAREQGTLELMRGPRGARIMNRLAHRQHIVAGFVTNVPGPSERLRLAGARVDAMWPVSVLAANVRLGVAALSYAGTLRCGIHFDATAVPGDVFAEAMRRELARLTGSAAGPWAPGDVP